VEWRSLVGLVLAAGLYVAGLAGVVKVCDLFMCYDEHHWSTYSERDGTA
jgi:hypothetical protein